jgi:feruloyl esterase
MGPDSRGVLTAAPTSCEQLASIALPNTTIVSAQLVTAGAFKPPAPARGGGRGAAAFAALPAFCRVAAKLTPTIDSDINIEVWLPAAGWNGKLQGVGNGGWAGTISYAALASAVAAGYAGVSTDTGHVGGSAQFAMGHPEKLIDLAYRSQHEMTVKAKALVEAFYGSAPKVSIWNGCSQGGRQGIELAERYPDDYHATIAGAPAVNWMNIHAGRMVLNRFMNRSAESAIPASKYPMIHDAVLDACDALDGVKDGVLEDPTRCRFDFKSLQCEGPDGPACLTAAQVESANALNAPVKHPRTGTVIYPGVRLGSERAWGIVGGAQPVGTALEAYKYVVFQDPNWDPKQFNPATDIDRTFKAFEVFATDVNLKPYFDRGGKLLLYQGWNDTQVAADNTVGYFNAVVSRVGRTAVGKSIQLYMVPGMDHCQGGDGTDTFDKVASMEQWIATGKAPESINGSRMREGRADRTRPICAYGSVAKWKGSGSTDEAASFACVSPGR